MKRTSDVQTIETHTRPCGCVLIIGKALGPMHACAEHRYMTCGKCGGQGEVTPFGFMCARCSFA